MLSVLRFLACFDEVALLGLCGRVVNVNVLVLSPYQFMQDWSM
jgi:hypothetical protein